MLCQGLHPKKCAQCTASIYQGTYLICQGFVEASTAQVRIRQSSCATTCSGACTKASSRHTYPTAHHANNSVHVHACSCPTMVPTRDEAESHILCTFANRIYCSTFKSVRLSQQQTLHIEFDPRFMTVIDRPLYKTVPPQKIRRVNIKDSERCIHHPLERCILLTTINQSRAALPAVNSHRHWGQSASKLNILTPPNVRSVHTYQSASIKSNSFYLENAN